MTKAGESIWGQKASLETALSKEEEAVYNSVRGRKARAQKGLSEHTEREIKDELFSERKWPFSPTKCFLWAVKKPAAIQEDNKGSEIHPRNCPRMRARPRVLHTRRLHP